MESGSLAVRKSVESITEEWHEMRIKVLFET
jgi:hypothetical protein